MFFYLKVIDKNKKNIDARLIVADDKKNAEEQAKKIINNLFDNGEISIKQEGIKHHLLFVSQQQHEENIKEVQYRQDKYPEMKVAALILSGGKHTPEKRLNYEQASCAIKLILEYGELNKNYTKAYKSLMTNLLIECEKSYGNDERNYGDIDEKARIERELSKIESVYFTCKENYNFPPALEGDIWQ